MDHCKAFGRIAFSCPSSHLESIESAIKENEGKILTPLVTLDTPGKASVQVVILADPVSSANAFRHTESSSNRRISITQDGHEICFVGDESFRQLSQPDVEADRLLSVAIQADESNEWFAKKGISKAQA